MRIRNILFIHQNFPGQFLHLANRLAADPSYRVAAICQTNAPGHPRIQRVLRYEPSRQVAESTHHYLRRFESGVLNGQAVAKCLLRMKQKGDVPDLIIAHPGWGEALYVKDIFPDVPLLNHCEFYYQADGADAGFDPEFPLDLDGRLRLRTRNSQLLLSLQACDAGIAPTHWQKSVHPLEYHSKISVIHEGIDTNIVTPHPDRCFTLPNGDVLTRGQEVITYVARNLEPYRGFHIFMRAAEEICRRRPNAQIVIVGGDDVSYGVRLSEGQTYRQKLLSEVTLDSARVHFLGKLPYADYLALLQVSSAHIYLTVPFVLSWSLLEAMACGCAIVASKTAPVEEVIEDGKDGYLVDFFSPSAIAEKVIEVLDDDQGTAAVRQAARQNILDHYALDHCLRAHIDLIEKLIGPSRSMVT